MSNISIDLLVDLTGGVPIYETVPAEVIGVRQYRIISSPGFAPGVASGDEIEFDASQKGGFKILKRAGNVCLQVFFSRLSEEERSGVVELVRTIDGWMDGGRDLSGQLGRLLIFTIPYKAGFPEIERVMMEIDKEYNVDRWMYGNVYEDDGVTPLNWWLMPIEGTESK